MLETFLKGQPSLCGLGIFATLRLNNNDFTFILPPKAILHILFFVVIACTQNWGHIPENIPDKYITLNSKTRHLRGVYFRAQNA